MHALVSGGAGFIGSNLVEALVRGGHRVSVLDNLSTGKRENLATLGAQVDVIEGDIRHYHTVWEALQGIEVVFHQAALPSVPRSVRDPLTSNAVNVDGTLNILYAAKDAGVKRVVYASSSSVYGDTPELPKHEGMRPNPQSPYAVSKLAAEQYCGVFTRLYGLETVALRYFNVFGPRQDPSSQYSAVIPKFIRAILAGERPVIYGDGEQTRDFTFVANVVDANLRAASATGARGVAMNCACHDRVSLNQLVAEINAILGTSVQPTYAEPRPGDIKHSFAAIDLAQKEIGYAPSVPFREGLQKTVAWYREKLSGTAAHVTR
ncbi:MAG TPA: SDR family oxidoreductase [Bacteroidota bacterium]|nr:SDR family oxidoreductase [Bacteroidota bacterium]